MSLIIFDAKNKTIPQHSMCCGIVCFLIILVSASCKHSNLSTSIPGIYNPNIFLQNTIPCIPPAMEPVIKSWKTPLLPNRVFIRSPYFSIDNSNKLIYTRTQGDNPSQIIQLNLTDSTYIAKPYNTTARLMSSNSSGQYTILNGTKLTTRNLFDTTEHSTQLPKNLLTWGTQLSGICIITAKYPHLYLFNYTTNKTDTVDVPYHFAHEITSNISSKNKVIIQVSDFHDDTVSFVSINLKGKEQTEYVQLPFKNAILGQFMNIKFNPLNPDEIYFIHAGGLNKLNLVTGKNDRLINRCENKSIAEFDISPDGKKIAALMSVSNYSTNNVEVYNSCILLLNLTNNTTQIINPQVH